MATVTVLPNVLEADGGLRRLAPAGPEDDWAGHDGRRVAPVRRRRAQPPGGWPRPVACDRSYAQDLHGSRLTARGKVVVGLLWAVLVTAMAVMISQSPAPPRPAETTTVVVQPGDTLWSLSADLVPGGDRRVTISQITELNGLRSAGDIRPGDVLVVPVADAP